MRVTKFDIPGLARELKEGSKSNWGARLSCCTGDAFLCFLC